MPKTEQQRLEETIAVYDADSAAETFAMTMQDGSAFEAWYEDFLECIPEEGKILDIGCGTGRDMTYFLDAGYDTLGIDLSEGMLEQARLAGVASHRLYHHDIRELDIVFDEETMDGLRMFAVLVHMSKDIAGEILEKAVALLKPGGTLHVAVKLQKEGESEEMVKESLSLPGVEKRYMYRKEEELIVVLRELGCTPMDISFDLYEERDSRIHILASKN